MTTPTFSTLSVLDVAESLGCVGVELRNDLAAGLFDGESPEVIRSAAAQRGLRILALSEVYAFNDNSDDTRNQVRVLAGLAHASGAEAIVLVPRLADTPVPRNEQRTLLVNALDALQPILEEMEVVALIEPLGFVNSTLRRKADTIDVLNNMGRPKCFALIHDTFHHALAGETEVYPDATRIIHISGVSDQEVDLSKMADSHRGLVAPDDRLGNIAQVLQMYQEGYCGPLSIEAFAPDVHSLKSPEKALSETINFVVSQLS